MVAVVGERVVRINPSCAVKVRLVVGRFMAEVMFMSPVVWVRERVVAVEAAAR